jgi:hypothetical protein
MYGNAPEIVGSVDVHPSEMCFVQYMPIKMGNVVMIPDRLKWAIPIIDLCKDKGDFEFMYLTAKYIWVNSNNMGNRKGWHSDGFMTDDINYIWYDCCPTEFCIQPFKVTMDHEKSMVEFAKQARQNRIETYAPGAVLRLDQSVIHRPSEQPYEGMRAFVKVSLSDSKYNLKGNARNELFDYDWEMKERSVSRNHPSA